MMTTDWATVSSCVIVSTVGVRRDGVSFHLLALCVVDAYILDTVRAEWVPV